MRQIGTIQEESSAKVLIAFLLTEDIKALAERADDHWEIWIKEEDDVETSKSYLQEFTKNPSDPKYAAAIETANRLAREEIERHEKNRQNVIVMRTNWSKPGAQKKPLVMTLMIICIAVFMMTRGWEYREVMGGTVTVPEKTVVLKSLLFVDPDDARSAVTRYVEDGLAEFELGEGAKLSGIEKAEALQREQIRLEREAIDDLDIKLTSIKQGQFWRLFTTMFIHFGLLHILFNMMWLNSLGGQFENTFGTFRFGVFVLTASMVGAGLQQLMPVNMQGTGALTMLGGMSGVNYALGGFIWMKSLYYPKTGLYLSPVSMFILILWMFMGIFDGGKTVCMANWAHGGGFVFGLLCGYLPILNTPQKRRS